MTNVFHCSDCAINSLRSSIGAQRLFLHVPHENLYIPVQKHFKLLISPSMAFSQWLSVLFVGLSFSILKSTSQGEMLFNLSVGKYFIAKFAHCHIG